MYIRQISIFLENRSGTLAEVTDFLYHQETLALLKQAQFTCTITDMLAIQMDDRPGSMAKVIRLLADADISIEYAYAFTTARAGTAITIVRVENNAAAEFVLKDTPFKSVGPEILDT